MLHSLEQNGQKLLRYVDQNVLRMRTLNCCNIKQMLRFSGVVIQEMSRKLRVALVAMLDLRRSPWRVCNVISRNSSMPFLRNPITLFLQDYIRFRPLPGQVDGCHNETWPFINRLIKAAASKKILEISKNIYTADPAISKSFAFWELRARMA